MRSNGNIKSRINTRKQQRQALRSWGDTEKQASLSYLTRLDGSRQHEASAIKFVLDFVLAIYVEKKGANADNRQCYDSRCCNHSRPFLR